MVGQQFIALLAESSVVQGRVARRQPALRGQGVPRRRGLAAAQRRCPTTSRDRVVEAATPGSAPQAGVLGARFVGGRRDRGGVRAKPATSSSATRGTTGWTHDRAAAHSRRSTPITWRCSTRRAAHGLEGPDRHQPELRDRRARDGARAAPAVRPEDDDDHDAAGDFRRRLSGRAVVGHPRQRHSAHRRRRRGEDRDRDEEDPRLAAATARSTITRCAQRARRRACRCRTATPDRFRSASSRSRPAEAIIDAWTSFRGRPQELELPSAPPQPIVYLHEANRPQPLARRQPRRRHDGHASAGCARVRCSTTSSSRSATTRFAAPPARRS